MMGRLFITKIEVEVQSITMRHQETRQHDTLSQKTQGPDYRPLNKCILLDKDAIISDGVYLSYQDIGGRLVEGSPTADHAIFKYIQSTTSIS